MYVNLRYPLWRVKKPKFARRTWANCCMKFSSSELSRTTWSVRCRTWNSECCLFDVTQFNPSCLVSGSAQGFCQVTKHLLTWCFIIWSDDPSDWIGAGTQRYRHLFIQVNIPSTVGSNAGMSEPSYNKHTDQSKWPFVHCVFGAGGGRGGARTQRIITRLSVHRWK